MECIHDGGQFCKVADCKSPVLKFTLCFECFHRVFQKFFVEHLYTTAYVYKTPLHYFFLISEMCGDPGANYKWICGEGAMDCRGSVLRPQCESDYSDYNIPDAEGRSCIPGTSSDWVLLP